MQNIKFKTLLILLLVLIFSILWLKFSPQQKTISSEIPQCYAGRCPVYYSFTVDNDPQADESEVIVPEAMTQGTGKLMIIKKGKIIFESLSMMQISVRPNEYGDGFVIDYADKVNQSLQDQELKYRFVNGKFVSDNRPIKPDTIESEIAYVKKAGYTVFENDLRYDEGSDFQVLIGMATGSVDGYAKKAFFFYKGNFIGNDSSQDSIDVGFKWGGGSTYALEYTLYKKDDSLSSPTAGAAIVRFEYKDGKLNALDPLPTADWNVDGHR
jgi:hypothetical protein